MKKYWTIFKTCLAVTFEYRGSLIIWFLHDLVLLATWLFLWSAAFRGQDTMGGYHFSQLTFYFILVPIVGAITGTHVSGILPFDIKSGDISKDILKPYNFASFWFLKPLAQKISQQLFKIPVFIVLLVSISLIFKIEFVLNNFLIGFAVCFFAYGLHYFLDLCVSYAAFWMDDVWVLTHLKNVCFTILAGMAFPLDLVFKGFQPILSFLPFRFFYFFPIQIIQGVLSVSEIILGIISLLIWMIFFFISSNILWKIGMKKYGAYGN